MIQFHDKSLDFLVASLQKPDKMSGFLGQNYCFKKSALTLNGNSLENYNYSLELYQYSLENIKYSLALKKEIE